MRLPKSARASRGLRPRMFTVGTGVKLALALMLTMALGACAHGGGIVYPSPDLEDHGNGAAGPVPDGDRADIATYQEVQAEATGGAIIVPDPSSLGIASAPNVHHALDLVSERSVVITASPGGWPVVIHNDAALLDQDGCAAVTLAQEGDTRLTMILPEPGVETYSRFYLVGCGTGTAILQIMSEGELLNIYEFEVDGQS